MRSVPSTGLLNQFLNAGWTVRGSIPPERTIQLNTMSYISGSSKQLLRLLEDAFEAGFNAGYHCEDNPGSYEEDWKEYLEKELEEYTDE